MCSEAKLIDSVGCSIVQLTNGAAPWMRTATVFICPLLLQDFYSTLLLQAVDRWDSIFWSRARKQNQTFRTSSWTPVRLFAQVFGKQQHYSKHKDATVSWTDEVTHRQMLLPPARYPFPHNSPDSHSLFPFESNCQNYLECTVLYERMPCFQNNVRSRVRLLSLCLIVNGAVSAFNQTSFYICIYVWWFWLFCIWYVLCAYRVSK